MLGLLKGLVENGFKVYLLTTEYENISFETAHEMSFINDVTVISIEKKRQSDKVVGLKKTIKYIIYRTYHFFFLFGNTNRIARMISAMDLPVNEYEYIISVSDPKTSHIALIELLKRGISAKKIIEYWGDPLYGDITLKSAYTPKTMKRIESDLLRPADSIFYTSPFTVRKEKELYPEFASKMFFTPTPSIIHHDNNQLKHKTNADFKIGYFGDYFTKVRNIAPLYNAMKNEEMKQMYLYIIGDSDIKLENRDNTEVLARRDVKQYEQDVDLLVCILNSRGTQIPGKIYYCASTFKPVLIIIDGDDQSSMKEFLLSFNRFYLCDNNEESIKAALIKIKEDDINWEPCPKLKESCIAKRFLE